MRRRLRRSTGGLYSEHVGVKTQLNQDICPQSGHRYAYHHHRVPELSLKYMYLLLPCPPSSEVLCELLAVLTSDEMECER
jgi:hypothetical protein